VAAFVDSVFAHVARAASGYLINCTDDTTLPLLHGSSAAAAADDPVGRVAVVANLRNAGGIAPNAVLQVLRIVLWLPRGSSFVLMYEDGSSDSTRHWLGVLQLLLAPIGVPFRVTLDGALARRPDEQRIAHLARLRNALVDPFYPATRGNLALAGCTRPHLMSAGSSSSSSSSKAAQLAALSSVPPACFRPDQFLFLNDVFFCRDDALRLLLHDADLACGYDVTAGYDRRRGAQRRRRRRRGLLGEGRVQGREEGEGEAPAWQDHQRQRQRHLTAAGEDQKQQQHQPPEQKLPKSFWLYGECGLLRVRIEGEGGVVESALSAAVW